MINLFVNQGLGEFDSSFIYDLKYEVLMGMSSSVPYDVINDFKTSDKKRTPIGYNK